MINEIEYPYTITCTGCKNEITDISQIHGHECVNPKADELKLTYCGFPANHTNHSPRFMDVNELALKVIELEKRLDKLELN